MGRLGYLVDLSGFDVIRNRFLVNLADAEADVDARRGHFAGAVIFFWDFVGAIWRVGMIYMWCPSPAVPPLLVLFVGILAQYVVFHRGLTQHPVSKSRKKQLITMKYHVIHSSHDEGR